MVMGAITLMMLQQHKFVNKLLENFEKVLGKQKLKDSFKIFRWNLEKHMFIEETNFFTAADKQNKNEMTQLNNLMRDHKDLKVIVGNLNEDILAGRKVDVRILKELLYAHEGREIKSFYPLLDERLSEKDKREIIEKVGDVSLG